METKEIQIPVPWGIIAAKTWGDEKDETIVLLHGYQDNAGTFDRLIPLLPKTFFYICLDLPGHGKSTHIPVATFVSFLDYIVALKIVLDHLDRKHYILMGHSFGAQTSMVFTQMYPEYVLKLIMLDAQSYLPIDPKLCLYEYKEIISRYFKHTQNNGKPPLYTKDDAVQRMRDARFAKISKESAEILMERSLTPSIDDKYTISSAQHLKYILRAPLTIEYHIDLLKHHPIRCPHLIIMAKDGAIHKKLTRHFRRPFERNKQFIMRVVQGDHDVHLEDPERVAPIVSKFLLKQYNSKL